MTAATLFGHTFIPIDETRYVSVAWEMWQRGDFLVPQLNGMPYSHKPPLLFWLIHLGWQLFGVNAWWPRLITPLASLASLLLTERLVKSLFPEQPALAHLAPTLLLSFLLWGIFSTLLMFDILLGLWVLLAILGIVKAAVGKHTGWLITGIALGLGTLTKGPVIYLHVLPVALLMPWWQERQNRPDWKSWYRGLALAIVIAAIISLAWVIPAVYSGGEQFRNDLLIRQTAERVNHAFAHARPWWWYFQYLPLLLFPWSLFPPLWQAGWRGLSTRWSRGTRFCLAWFLPVLCGFTLISAKQIHYLIPLFPALALLGGHLLLARTTSIHPSALILPAMVIILTGLAVTALPWLAASHPEWPTVARNIPFWSGLLIVATGLLPWLIAHSTRRTRLPLSVTTILALGVILFIAEINFTVIRYMDAALDPRPASQFLRLQQDKGRPIAHIGRYHGQFQFPGRLKQPLTLISDAQAVAWANAHPDGLIIRYWRKQPKTTLPGERWRQPFRTRWMTIQDSDGVK